MESNLYRPKGHDESPGFMVFITVPGVVTHKVPFTATSDYNGEYSFNIHGLHFIDASEEFRQWNKEKNVGFCKLGVKLLFDSYCAIPP